MNEAIAVVERVDETGVRFTDGSVGKRGRNGLSFNQRLATDKRPSPRSTNQAPSVIFTRPVTKHSSI